MKNSYNIVQNKFSKNNIMTSSSLKTIVKKKKNTKQKYKNTAHLFVKFRQTNNKRRDATSKVQNNIISKDQTTINITVYKKIYISRR